MSGSPPRPPRPPKPGWSTSSTPKRSSARNKKHGHEFTDPKRGMRLQKVLAAAGVASRRECESIIEQGVVKVNGHLVQSLPAFVDPMKDSITVRGKKIRTAEPHVYVMLFKPRGVLSTNDDPEGRMRAIDLVKHPSRARLYPVGRLDLESSGLLLLTNDGELAARLTHPRYGVHKSYEVTVRGRLEENDVKRLERGIFLGDRDQDSASRTSRSRLRIIRRSRDRTRLMMDLTEGRNRQIRRMLAQLGYPVKKLRRVKMGPVKLTGLRPSQWRDLEPREIDALYKSAGLPKRD
ncbi:MAG: pseudouridine synthase [Planctomycetota bacterium]